MRTTLPTLASRFKEVRESHLGLKQKELATQLGVSPSHISGIESGKKIPSDRLVELFCLKFNISKEWLLYGSENLQVTNDSPNEGYKYGNFEINKNEDYETATGYVIRYMKLLKFFCVAGDFNQNFDEIIEDSNLEVVLNYIVKKFLCCKEDSQNFKDEFVDTFSKVMPDFNNFSRTYIREKSDELAYRLEHRPHIWELAENVEKILEPKGGRIVPYRLGDLMIAEEKLLMCNISGIVEMFSDKLCLPKSIMPTTSSDEQ